MAKQIGNLVGAWAFLIGVVLSIILGLFSNFGNIYWIWALIVIGLVIGFFNIAAREAKTFMTASIVLVLVSYMGQSVLSVIPEIGQILGALLTMFVPATIVVALKTVFSVAKN
jgi:hypothetical protein